MKTDIILDIAYKNDDVIQNILDNCSPAEYNILRDVIIATKKSIDLNMNFKS